MPAAVCEASDVHGNVSARSHKFDMLQFKPYITISYILFIPANPVPKKLESSSSTAHNISRLLVRWCLFQGGSCLFQQGNANLHSASVRKSGLPAARPESIWCIVKQQVRERRPGTVEQLESSSAVLLKVLMENLSWGVTDTLESEPYKKYKTCFRQLNGD